VITLSGIWLGQKEKEGPCQRNWGKGHVCDGRILGCWERKTKHLESRTGH